MKKIVISLVFILIFGGITAFVAAVEVIGYTSLYFLYTLILSLPHLPTSIFGIIDKILLENWSFTNIPIIDSLLLHLATFIPPIITFGLLKQGIKLNGFLSGAVATITLVLVLELFQSIIFWIIIGIVVTALFIIIVKLSKGTKEQVSSQ